MEHATDEDAALAPRIFAAFYDKLLEEKSEATATKYVKAFRNLFNLDGYKVESMATEEYWQDVKARPENQGNGNQHSACVRSFITFWNEQRPPEWRDVTLQESKKWSVTLGADRKRKADALPETKVKEEKESKKEKQFDIEEVRAKEMMKETEATPYSRLPHDSEEKELHPNPVFTWFECKGRRGSDVKSLPASWPPGLEIFSDRWVHWLPEDWLQGAKPEFYSGDERVRSVFVNPEGRVFRKKGEVEKFLGRALEGERGEIPVWPDYLPRDWFITDRNKTFRCSRYWLYPDGDSYAHVEGSPENFKRIMAHLNGTVPVPRPKTLIVVSQETLQRMREAARIVRMEEQCDGCSLQRSADVEWSVLPNDVLTISLDVFSKHFQDAGWKAVSQTSEQLTLTGQVELTLFCESGKLLIRSDEQAVVLDIAERYLNWLSNAQ